MHSAFLLTSLPHFAQAGDLLISVVGTTFRNVALTSGRVAPMAFSIRELAQISLRPWHSPQNANNKQQHNSGSQGWRMDGWL